ncbi:MAG: alpha-glucan family phosphorylase, partial [Bacteroidales bacterium]|nr:alpha-glucan family phosphorylase [Bacteroidales bacterium]
YRYGYFKQILSVNGEQHEIYDPEHYSKLPLIPAKDEKGIWKTISIVFPGRTVTARIWEVKVGRVSLYLLDTDHEDNLEKDRFITHHLYGGDKENRLKQELLLGIGGIRVLRVLGINADLFHSNEGHSAFIGLERLRILISENNLSFTEALEVVRASTLFTTHTPVPAGHDAYDENLLRTYIAHYPERLKISWDEFMAFGRSNPENRNEKFNMSYLAAKLSQEINAVSKLHGEVTREMFSKLWPGYLPRELHIGYVTNGVHYSTWVAREWLDLYQKKLGKSIVQHQSEKECWEEIYKFKDEVIWKTKQNLRSQLISYVKERFRYNWIRRHENPKHIGEITRTLNDKALTIGFARRFATYKRANLIFKDIERLSKIVNDPEKPVQFLFAGKAHPKDGGGKELIKKVFKLSKRPEFLGKILFLQNYDMDLAKKLVQGVDIWLNTPTRPMEASGTSGEKAVMNGTLHFSVL